MSSLLSPTALDALIKIARAPMPRQALNPGVARKLEREGLVESFEASSPYKTVKGRVRYLRVTMSGRDLLSSRR